MKRLIIAFICLCVFSCQKAVEPGLTGEVQIALRGDFSGTDSGLAEVSGTGMQITGAQLEVTDSTVSGTIGAIPPGSNRTLTISLFHGTTLKYTGKALFDLADDETLSISIRLIPVDLPPSSECRPAGIEIETDTMAGIYTITWQPYEDSVEFVASRLSYVLVFDTVRINDDFGQNGTVIFWDNQVNVTMCTKEIGPETRAHFRLFLYAEKYHEVIADCIDRFVLVRENGM